MLCVATAVQDDLWLCISRFSAKDTDTQQLWQMPNQRPQTLAAHKHETNEGRPLKKHRIINLESRIQSSRISQDELVGAVIEAYI